MTEKQQETIRVAVGAIGAWLSSEDGTSGLDRYVDALAAENHPDLEVLLSSGLTIVSVILVRRLAEAKGTDPHQELAAIVRMTEQFGGD